MQAEGVGNAADIVLELHAGGHTATVIINKDDPDERPEVFASEEFWPDTDRLVLPPNFKRLAADSDPIMAIRHAIWVLDCKDDPQYEQYLFYEQYIKRHRVQT